MPEKFWILESPRSRIAKWDIGNIWMKSDYQDCLQDGSERAYVGYGCPARRLLNLRIILRTKDIPDFVWTIPDCIIQDHVLEMFRERGVTGFQVRQVRARFEPSLLTDRPRHHDAPVPRLWELLVTGWGGVAATESGLVRIPNTNAWEGCPDWSRMIDWDSWDGSDFFIVWPFPHLRLVSDRVASFMRENKLSGARLVTPEEQTRMFARLDRRQSLSLRLRDYYPDARAREIGEPLGIY